jgi:hypothetical protein
MRTTRNGVRSAPVLGRSHIRPAGEFETAGARAVPARSIADCAAGVELIATAIALRSRCEPGTARAPVTLLRCVRRNEASPCGIEAVRDFEVANESILAILNFPHSPFHQFQYERNSRTVRRNASGASAWTQWPAPAILQCSTRGKSFSMAGKSCSRI